MKFSKELTELGNLINSFVQESHDIAQECMNQDDGENFARMVHFSNTWSKIYDHVMQGELLSMQIFDEDEEYKIID